MTRIVLLLLTGTLSGAIAIHIASNRSATGPLIACPDQISIGCVESGSEATATVPIVNRGASELRLSQFRASCGCMSFEFAGSKLVRDQQITIAPCETAVVSVKLRPTGTTMVPRVDTVRFRTNDPGAPEFQVLLQSNLQGFLYAQPQSISETQLAVGSECFKEIRILNNGANASLSITRVVSGDPSSVIVQDWRLVSSASKDESPSEVARATLRLVPPKDFRRLDTQVTFFADETNIPYAVVPIAIQCQPDIAINPSTVFLPRFVEGSRRFECRCLVRRCDGRAFHVTASPDRANASRTDSGNTVCGNSLTSCMVT